jgi:hypothetical protein
MDAFTTRMKACSMYKDENKFKDCLQVDQDIANIAQDACLLAERPNLKEVLEDWDEESALQISILNRHLGRTP